MHRWIGVLAIMISSAAMAQQPTDKITVTLGLGTGYMLCEHFATPPPLETAFDCSQLQPTIENFQVDLLPQKTAKPEWLMYSGTVKGTIRFQNFTAKYELLISLVSADGQKVATVAGSMIDNVNKKVVYFRGTAPERFENMSYMVTYGTPVYYTSGGEKSDFIPVLAFGKPRAE